MARALGRVLIANRGEIAVRVIRACRAAAVSPVAVCSDADTASLHVELADQAIRLGPAPARESYLSIAAIIDAARSCGADAIHPGYGFLSENAAFADACRDAGLVFIGPPPQAIERMGSKIEARRVAEAEGVPVVPGARPSDQSVESIRAAATHIGFPLLLKAAAGGGGKGMRVVRQAAELDELIAAARGESERAFADGTLYVERLLESPRHVEVQLIADDHGSVVHLFERDCSAQRRHQKVVEESPSPALLPSTRAAMCDAACRVARAVGYRNAGTVEFLVEGHGIHQRFYFLEMNTRLQVEHPVTEEVCGVDLVRAQLRVANGLPLPWRQEDLTQRGHAIECRVYAEDPAREFLPQAGPLLWYHEPQGPGVRVDSGVRAGDSVGVHYDPLLAKLIVRDESRAHALTRMASALDGFGILGLRTNLSFLRAIIRNAVFDAGSLDVTFIDTHLESLLAAASADQEACVAAAVGAVMCSQSNVDTSGRPEGVGSRDPWELLEGWRT